VSDVAVVGSTGRVGAAVVRHLASRYDVDEISRALVASEHELANRAIRSCRVVLNAAGVAHIEHVDPATLERLRSANIALPLHLAGEALRAGCSFIHISSSKATTPEESPYAESKRAGDEALEEQFATRFADAGLSLTVVRPMALLFPPLDAGKLRHLRLLGRIPLWWVPEVRLPVLAPMTFLNAIDSLVHGALSGQNPAGFSIRDFAASERGTLRDVAVAFRSTR
jgi:nucleoside-diphosphate-sugar epimerase